EPLPRELRGEVVVDRATAARLSLAQHLAELGEHLAELAHVEALGAGHPAGHAREPAEPERAARPFATALHLATAAFVVRVAVGRSEAERDVTHGVHGTRVLAGRRRSPPLRWHRIRLADL